MARGSARFNQFVRGQIGGGEDRLTGWARSGRDVAGALRSGTLRVSAIVWAVVALVLLAGSRHLITRGVPAVGELVAFTSSPMDLLREWASGWRTAGLGSEAPAPTAYGLLGGLGLISAGTMGLLRTVLTVGLVPLGAILALPPGRAHRLPARPAGRPARVRVQPASVQRAGGGPLECAGPVRRGPPRRRAARPSQRAGPVRRRGWDAGTGCAHTPGSATSCSRSGSSRPCSPRSSRSRC